MKKYTFVPHSDGVDIYTEQASVKMHFLFQPIYQPKTNTVLFYEVLSQVESQSGYQYNSDDFFTNIDSTFIQLLSISQLDYISTLPLARPVSINLPLSALLNSPFIHQLMAYAIMNFAIEITAIDTDCESHTLQLHIQQLKEVGIMIWLDDYHSDRQDANDTLGVIAWDFIKIDRTFLHHHTQHSESLQALAFALAPFTTFGLIYEGIETGLENDLIARTNALAQGYYLSYPKTWQELKLEICTTHNEKVVQNQNYRAIWKNTRNQAVHHEAKPYSVH